MSVINASVLRLKCNLTECVRAQELKMKKKKKYGTKNNQVKNDWKRQLSAIEEKQKSTITLCSSA